MGVFWLQRHRQNNCVQSCTRRVVSWPFIGTFCCCTHCFLSNGFGLVDITCRHSSGSKMLLCLLSCWIIAGIAAEDPPMKHYRMKGSSLCLQVGKSPPYNKVQWSFSNKLIVFEKNITPAFKDKVDYSPGNHSLCIRNLTETDVGIYKAVVTDPKFELSDETHSLIIQEPLPTPVIWMSERYSNRSAGICNITVNCSIQGWWLWSVCDEDSCTPSQRSFSEVNISISAVNASIVCKGNNHVSSSNASESLEAMCFNKSNSKSEMTLKVPIVVVIIVIVCAFVCAFIGSACFAWRHFKAENNHHQVRTSPDQLIQNQPHPVPRVSISSSSEAEASYENVDATQPPVQSQNADTIYSLLQASNASVGKTDGSAHTRGHPKEREALTSRTVTVDEAAQPLPIDTLYCALQKPKNMRSQHHL